jgi:hypothetical protein
MSTLKKFANKKMQNAIEKTKKRDDARKPRNAKKQMAAKSMPKFDNDEIDSDEVVSVDEDIVEQKDEFFVEEGTIPLIPPYIP